MFFSICLCIIIIEMVSSHFDFLCVSHPFELFVDSMYTHLWQDLFLGPITCVSSIRGFILIDWFYSSTIRVLCNEF